MEVLLLRYLQPYFQGITTTTLYKYAPIPTFPVKREIPMLLIFAILCSNPHTINTKIHQKIIINLPDSDFIFIPHHTARHTKMLHNTALKNNGIGAVVVFVIARFSK